jgi:hypothetical protein
MPGFYARHSRLTCSKLFKTWMAGTKRAFTPSSTGYGPAMTEQ